jgi:DNA polymerase-3 subunit epsilon
MTFCVVDVETTGFHPASDGIVELALVRMDASGRVYEELHSLVDPQRPVDATFVHGLDEADLRGAPVFADLLADVRRLLDGSLLVAHNASFDMSFLAAEMDRAGEPVGELPYLCTMALRRQVGLPGPTVHRLAWACWQEGLWIENAHAAACDARATGALLARYLAYGAQGGLTCLGDLRARGRAADSWASELPRRTRSRSATGTAPTRVRLVRCRPGVSPTPPSLLRDRPASDHAVRAYAVQLAAAAEDFEVDEEEFLELSDLVAELGLTANQVRAVHTEHVRQLLIDRLDDGRLTWAEQQEVRAFARLLGVGGREVMQLLIDAEQLGTVEGKASLLGGEATGTGLSVCFTGEFVAIPLTREEVWDLAQDAGMVVSKGVTKKLDLLVCLDPGTGTGKLTKAADYGTVVIDQPTFLGLAGVHPAPDGVLHDVLDRLAAHKAAAADTAQARREAAAQKARESNRQRARERRASPSAEQVLWCIAGEHEWHRRPQRGRPPKACPEHQTAVV